MREEKQALLSNTKKKGFPGGSVVKNLPAKEEDKGLIPGSGRTPGERFCLGIPCTEQPGGLHSSWGCKRVGHKLATKKQKQMGEKNQESTQ